MAADPTRIRRRCDAPERRGFGLRICPSESAAAAASARSTPFGALLAGHILRDGEIVVLLLRPSRWFIMLSSMRFVTIVAILTIAGIIFAQRYEAAVRLPLLEIGLLLAAGRLIWGVLQWMSRLYILTNLRILRLSGVFNVEIYDCALRKVARSLLDRTLPERLCRIGSILIIPQEEDCPIGSWQMVAEPGRVQQQVAAAIARARQGGAD
jgi:hypothetical protein